jgi:hypothetical protein
LAIEFIRTGHKRIKSVVIAQTPHKFAFFSNDPNAYKNKPSPLADKFSKKYFFSLFNENSGKLSREAFFGNRARNPRLRKWSFSEYPQDLARLKAGPSAGTRASGAAGSHGHSFLTNQLT